MKAINYLIKVKEKYGLTHAEMAARLKMHRVSWHRKQTGKQGVTERDKFNAVQAFPELSSVFLPSNVNSVNNRQPEETSKIQA